MTKRTLSLEIAKYERESQEVYVSYYRFRAENLILSDKVNENNIYSLCKRINKFGGPEEFEKINLRFIGNQQRNCIPPLAHLTRDEASEIEKIIKEHYSGAEVYTTRAKNGKNQLSKYTNNLSKK